jgi:hypothetical protein
MDCAIRYHLHVTEAALNLEADEPASLAAELLASLQEHEQDVQKAWPRRSSADRWMPRTNVEPIGARLSKRSGPNCFAVETAARSTGRSR